MIEQRSRIRERTRAERAETLLPHRPSEYDHQENSDALTQRFRNSGEHREITFLWENFWAHHGDGNRAFDRLVWLTRNALSVRHARILAKYSDFGNSRRYGSGRILEVGSGSAATSKHLKVLGPNLRAFAVDLSVAALKLARARNPRIHCVVADALTLPFAHGQFSLTFSSGVLEHFDRPIAHRMQSEHSRVTELGGSVAVIVPERNTAYDLVRRACGKKWPFGKESPFSRVELRGFASENLLERLKVVGSYWITLTVVGTKILPSVGPPAEVLRTHAVGADLSPELMPAEIGE